MGLISGPSRSAFLKGLGFTQSVRILRRITHGRRESERRITIPLLLGGARFPSSCTRGQRCRLQWWRARRGPRPSAAAVASSPRRLLHPPPPKSTGPATLPLLSRSSGVEIHQELAAVSSFAGQEILWASLFFRNLSVDIKLVLKVAPNVRDCSNLASVMSIIC